jgi:hypothetical protein
LGRLSKEAYKILLSLILGKNISNCLIMSKVKKLATIALSVFAISFIYQVGTKSFTNQGGDFKRYADESEANVKRMEEAFAKSHATTESLSANTPSSDAKPNEVSSFRFPQSSCGDKPKGENDTWYPVFIDGADLESIRANYCADAVATTRKDTGVETVQLASLTSYERALELAKTVNGDVGEPTIAQTNSNNEPSQQASVEVSPIEQTTLEGKIQQQEAETAILEATNRCHEEHIEIQRQSNEVRVATLGHGDNIVSDFVDNMTEASDDIAKAALEACLLEAQSPKITQPQ